MAWREIRRISIIWPGDAWKLAHDGFHLPQVDRWVALYRRLRLILSARKQRTSGGQRGDHALGRPESCLQERELPVRRWIRDREIQHFHAKGYMVIRKVVPPSMTSNALREIAAFVGADLANNATWYGGAAQLDGVVPFHHAQSLWDIRQLPDLYEVFTEFFGNMRLMVDINRCIFCPPVHPDIPTISRGTIHWDSHPRMHARDSLQAVVLLTDVRRNGGGFQCIPEVYQNLDLWLERYAWREDFDFFNPGLNHWKTTQIEGKAGDVILWSTKLPHGTTPNLSKRPRAAFFVTMQPPGDYENLRELMKTWWLTKEAPSHWRGMPGQVNPEPGAPAALSELGLKLIGALPW